MAEKIAIYPGSFDPLTNGHLDILQRASKIFDKIVIAVTRVESKRPLFTIEERLSMLRQACRGYKKVSAESFSGLLVDYARRKRAAAIIRGLRAVSDFEYEFQMALMNRHLSQNAWGQALETVYLMPDEKYTYLSSTMVREVARLQGNVRNLVPDFIHRELMKKFRSTSTSRASRG